MTPTTPRTAGLQYLAECMGSDTSYHEARIMQRLLVDAGWAGTAIADIPEAAWNELLGQAINAIPANLHDYQTGQYLRPATAEELAASIAAAETDGGAGVIEVDGRTVYAVEA